MGKGFKLLAVMETSGRRRQIAAKQGNKGIVKFSYLISHEKKKGESSE